MIAALPIAAIAIVLAAILYALLYYGGHGFARALGNMMPSLPWPINDKLRNAVSGAATAVIDYVLGLLAATITPVAHAVLYPVYLINHLVARIRDAVGALYSRLQWVVGAELPALELRVESLVQSRTSALWTSLANVRAGLGVSIAYTRRLLTEGLDRLGHSVDAAVATAEGYARTEIAALSRATAAGITAVRQDLGHDLNTATAYLEGAVAAAESAAKAYGLHAAEAALGAATGEIEHLAATVPATAAAVAVDVIGITATDIDNVIAPAIDGIIDDVAGIAGVIGSDFPDIGSIIKSLDISKAAGVAGELGLSLAISRIAARYLKDCGIPHCRSLGGLSNLLQDLLSAAGLAELLAMLITIVKDPEGAAQETITVVTPIADTAHSLINDLLAA